MFVKFYRSVNSLARVQTVQALCGAWSLEWGGVGGGGGAWCREAQDTKKN